MTHRSWTYLAGVISAVALGGCASVVNLETAEAEIVRKVIAEHCVIGTWVSSGGPYQKPVDKMRLGQVGKRNDPITFRSRLPIHAEQVYVHAIRARADGWTAADASSGGVRDNLYFNRGTGEIACSTDEWRTVRTFPERYVFETSPLVKPGARP